MYHIANLLNFAKFLRTPFFIEYCFWYFIPILDLYQKWGKATLTAHLISASCAKNHGERNYLTLCLFTESARTGKLVYNFGNGLSTPSLSTKQKQPPEVFCMKRCSKKIRKIHRCFSVNFVKFLRTPFLQNTSGRLFLTKELEVAEVKAFAKYFETTKPIDELLSLCFLCI